MRTAGFFQTLYLSDDVRQTCLGKQVDYVAVAFLENAEEVAGIDGFPGWERREYGSD